MQFLFGVLLLTSMSVEAAARACPLLFEDGHSFWRVRIPAERTRPIDFAATELTNVIARISGGAAGEVGIEAASFADWARLAEDARTGRTTYEMPERHGKDVFATLPVLRLRPLRHPSCGWPVAAHGDIGLAATLEFSHL